MAMPENPYNSPVVDLDDRHASNSQQAYGKRMMIGFLIGAAIPLAAGVYIVLRSQVHAEFSDSTGFVSGVIPLRAILLIFIASPSLGIVGAIVSRFWRA